MRSMSSDAIAVLGFVVLFVLMLLRMPVGMAMGLVGVSGFAYIVGGAAALKSVGHTTMRTVTDYNFAVVPLFLLMGAFATTSGMSRELFRGANAFVGHLRGDLGLVGGDRGYLLEGGLSGNARLRLSAVLRHRRDRRRRHARHHDPALDRA